jgi:pyruvate/2-oxoglutarate dehydrogenase complex dihydrolipoamide dehydrogenase (E3) component
MSKKLSKPNPRIWDVAIVGGGSAGYAAARTAAAEGLRTVVIEGGNEVGGLCILRGCMPSKALLYAAEVLHLARKADTWGLSVPRAGFDFTAVMARKAAMIEDFARFRRQELTSGKFGFIRAQARFVDPHTLELSHGNKDAPAFVRAKNFILCAGSVVPPPPLPALDAMGCLTSDDALSLRTLPESLLILGGGLVGVELAQFFRRFDVDVTLVQRSIHLLSGFDTDAAAVVENVFRREGIKIWEGTKLLGAFAKDGEKGVTIRHRGRKKRLRAREILLALGRVPATTGLGLEKAGVETEDGRIRANAEMQTSAPHIYTAGDCTGPHEIVHIGIEQGEIAAHNIARPRRKRAIDYRLLTTVVFTDPQVGVVGLTEKEARRRKIPYLAASHPFPDHGKSMIMAATDGFVKLLADAASGEILGGACAGPLGGELIHEIIAAMHKRMTVEELAAMPHYHPTLAEIWSYPACELAERRKQKTCKS